MPSRLRLDARGDVAKPDPENDIPDVVPAKKNYFFLR